MSAPHAHARQDPVRAHGLVAFVLALGLHGGLGMLLREQRTAPHRQARPLEMVFVHRAQPGGTEALPPVIAPLPAERRMPSRRTVPPVRRTAPPAPVNGRPQAAPSDAQQVAPGAAAPRSPLRLFPTEVLRGIAQGPALGSAAPAPPGAPAGPQGPASEGGEINRRIQGWLADAVGRDRVRGGDMPPRWRSVERRAAELFAPPAEVVRSQHRVLAMVDQILKSPDRVRSQPLRRGERENKTLPGTPEGMNLPALPQEQTASVQAAWEDLNDWRTTELEMLVEASGDIASLRVVGGSGSPQLDRIAMAAVRKAAQQSPGAGEPVGLRWVVRSAISVVPPDRVGFSFDENALFDRKRRLFSNGRAPFMEKVRTDVRLESYQPRK